MYVYLSVKHVPFVSPQTLDHRRQTGERRNDMIDHFLDAMNNAEKNVAEMNQASEGQFEKDAAMASQAKVTSSNFLFDC